MLTMSVTSIAAAESFMILCFSYRDIFSSPSRRHQTYGLEHLKVGSDHRALPFIKRALEEDVDQLDTHLIGEARRQDELLAAHSSKQYWQQIQCLLYSQLRSL